MLKIYNTMSKEKEIFKPLQEGKVGIYVCGITPYDYCHIGHARGTFLIFDMLNRYLKFRGYGVKFVRNITDIDDKIIKRAEEKNEPFQEFTARFIKALHEDEKTLNVLPPDVEPLATEYIQPMQDMIQNLIDKDYAYVGSTGDVYYKVHNFKTYGCLAHRDLDDLQAGARVDINEAKQSPLDFVLWKMAKPNEPKWPSPWGEGRPGWHIECSVMSLLNLGETFDIHGGGADLKFPHHENERAQSEASSGKKFVNIWMHVGFVQLEKEKMSKSLGNFLTIRDFLQHYDAELLRYFSIASHYRSPVDYSKDHIETAGKALDRLYTTLRGLPNINVNEAQKDSEFETRFIEAMDDDLNTPEALAVLFDLAREINRIRETNLEAATKLGSLLKKLGNVLGLLYRSPEEFLQNLSGKEIDATEIEALIAARNAARKAKNWAESDKVRDDLLARGISLEDTPGGTIWHIKAAD